MFLFVSRTQADHTYLLTKMSITWFFTFLLIFRTITLDIIFSIKHCGATGEIHKSHIDLCKAQQSCHELHSQKLSVSLSYSCSLTCGASCATHAFHPVRMDRQLKNGMVVRGGTRGGTAILNLNTNATSMVSRKSHYVGPERTLGCLIRFRPSLRQKALVHDHTTSRTLTLPDKTRLAFLAGHWEDTIISHNHESKR